MKNYHIYSKRFKKYCSVSPSRNTGCSDYRYEAGRKKVKLSPLMKPRVSRI